MGLGLAVARGFVEAMKGELSLEDTPGGGCTAVIALPQGSAAVLDPAPELARDAIG